MEEKIDLFALKVQGEGGRKTDALQGTANLSTAQT